MSLLCISLYVEESMYVTMLITMFVIRSNKDLCYLILSYLILSYLEKGTQATGELWMLSFTILTT